MSHLVRSVDGGVRRYGFRLRTAGLASALAFFSLSTLPSLLPRPWLYQGLISGISLAMGYGVGVGVESALRWTLEYQISPGLRASVRRGLVVVGVVVVTVFLGLGSAWQDQVHELVGQPRPDGRYAVRILVVAMVTAAGLLAMGRSIRALFRWTVARVDRVLPRRASIGLGFLVVGLGVWWVLSGVFFNFFVTQSNRIYADHNESTPPGLVRPSSPNRSGGPESLVDWETLGYQGKAFVAGGPSAELLGAYAGGTPKDPIRIYAGLNSAPDATERAELAVRELLGTDAFDREILVLATATGTGWLQPQAVDAIEYMHGGDTAIVSQQYSYLPSWISFLVDKEAAHTAGRALFNAVYAEWSVLPEDDRPRLIAYGLSLGAFGGQAAYSGVDLLTLTIDGALFVGSPNDSLLWSDLTAQRDAGSPEVLPVFEGGRNVRFAATGEQIEADSAGWQEPRVLFVQHASDPVVWFSFDLLHRKPDWLAEPRGDGVSPNMRWYPFVTFFQVAIDQSFGVAVPNGHGHNYAETMVSAWAAVAEPEGWNEEKAERLRAIIATYPKN